MPELPEVETIRQQIQKHVVGESILSVVVNTPSVVRGDYKKLEGKHIIGTRRFSKMIVLDFSDNISVLIHLKMTGRLIYQPKLFSANMDVDYDTSKHTHLMLRFASGSTLLFHDYRRFGYLHITERSCVEKNKYISGLGKEFFSNLSAEEFYQILHTKKRAVKHILLDQTQVSGVGNIYANEALWLSSIHPSSRCDTLPIHKTMLLFHSLEEVMKQAIEHHGASSDNFRDLFGNKGSAQQHFNIYGKQKKPCLRCQTIIEKYIFGGRGTYVCSNCQKL
jgi:formamidopyrimidine-DNA glycosylase